MLIANWFLANAADFSRLSSPFIWQRSAQITASCYWLPAISRSGRRSRWLLGIGYRLHWSSQKALNCCFGGKVARYLAIGYSFFYYWHTQIFSKFTQKAFSPCCLIWNSCVILIKYSVCRESTNIEHIVEKRQRPPFCVSLCGILPKRLVHNIHATFRFVIKIDDFWFAVFFYSCIIMHSRQHYYGICFPLFVCNHSHLLVETKFACPNGPPLIVFHFCWYIGFVSPQCSDNAKFDGYQLLCQWQRRKKIVHGDITSATVVWPNQISDYSFAYTNFATTVLFASIYLATKRI